MECWRRRYYAALLFIAALLLIVGCARDLPTPTPVPTATPTPTPSPTPIPLYEAVWNSLEHAHWLDRNAPASASAIKSLPWVADGIDEAERDEVQQLAYLASVHPSVFDALIIKSWVVDGPDETERALVMAVRSIADRDESAALQVLTLPFLDTFEPGDEAAVSTLADLAAAGQGNNIQVFEALIEKSWVSNGLNELERAVVDDIRSIADSDVTAALQTLALPFLDTVGPDDALAVGSLLRLVVYRQGDAPNIFNALIEKSWVADGLDETERVIVGSIRGIADHDESAGLQLLDSPFLDTIELDDRVTVETLLTFTQDYGQQLSIDPIKALIEKSWVADGLDSAEQEMIGNIRWIASNSKSAALQVIALPFLDTFEPGDGAAVQSIAYIVAAREGNNLSVFDALIEKSWVGDGLDKAERTVVDDIRSISDSDVTAALQILALPFLDIVEPDDRLTVASLLRLVSYRQGDVPNIFNALIEKSWVADGLDENERVMVGNIRWVADHDESTGLQFLASPFLDTIEPDDSVTMETLLSFRSYFGQQLSIDPISALIKKSWVADGLDEVEIRIVRSIGELAVNHKSIAVAVIEKPWTADGPDEVQSELVALVGDIRWIADNDQSAALQVLSLPFLDTLELGDGATVEFFAHLFAYSQGNPLRIFDAFIAKSWVADGLAENEMEVLSKVKSIGDSSEDIALQILDMPFLETIETADGHTIDALNPLITLRQEESLQVFDALAAKSWVPDGLNEAELRVVRHIRLIADNSESAALQILDMPFLETIEVADGFTMDALSPLVVHRQGDSLQVFDALAAKSWVPDGLNDAERGVIRDIRWIADRDEDAALRVLDMPFLDVVQTPDKHAMAALNGMDRHSRDHSLRLMEHPLIGGGISDRTARIVSILPHFVNRDEPDWDLVDALLEPDNDLLEERTITLPLAGEVALALIRTTPGSERNMGYLEHAVRVNEEFTGVPFPKDYVAVLFADIPGTGGGGAHYGTHIVAGPLHDNGGDDYVTTYSHGLLAHETAHYYWRYGKIWINEGAASFMTEIAQLARIGRFWRDHFVLCGHVDTIAELDAWSPSYGDIGSECHYALGERLFMDLYSELGDAEFRKGFRNLYLLTQVQGDECEGTSLNICHLRAAFVHGADEEAAAIAQRVIARWYDGTEPYATTEVVPPDPFIPSIGGRVNMLVSATHGGPSIQGKLYESERIAENHPHVRLTLRYNYPPGEPTRDVEFKVLTYFEDRFAFHSGTVKFNLQSGHRQTSSHWTSVGLSPHKPWPIGRYWVSAYLDGVKVAEESFEVLP